MLASQSHHDLHFMLFPSSQLTSFKKGHSTRLTNKIPQAKQ
uniref:Uncharacterized protein n=1 Tax=Anguilla anguilla TaxID=7936 RepID=A0A0E9RJP6_ANGAN